MADAPKMYSLLSIGKRRFPLKGNDARGKERAIEPGGSRSDLTEKEFNILSKYPDLVDPAKFVPGGADIVAENATLKARVKELEAAQAKASPAPDQDDKSGKPAPKK